MIDDIQGWFTFKWLYDWVAREAGRSARMPTFVEVGVWKGKSLLYLCERLLAEHRSPFYLCAVDTWSMDPTGSCNGMVNEHLDKLRTQGRTLRDDYQRNVCLAGYRHLITDFVMPSVRAAEVIGPADFVFIDADHSADAVAADVAAWRPKAAVLAGHDVFQPSVFQGLCRSLGEGNFHVLAGLNCWTTHEPMARAWGVEWAYLVDQISKECADGECKPADGSEPGRVRPLVCV